jgi:cysteinyl-tRNA synthetase
MNQTDQKVARLHGRTYKIFEDGTIVPYKEASRSCGHILESKELVSKYHVEVLKLAILSCAWQGKVERSEVDFQTAEKRLYYFYQTLKNMKQYANENSALNEHVFEHGKIIKPDLVTGIEAAFVAAMNDGQNTSLAITQFFQVFKYANALLQNKRENPLHKLTTLNEIYKNMLKVAHLLGIFLEEPEVFILELKEKYIAQNQINMNEVLDLIRLRQEAKQSRNYELSDELKSKLEQKGIVIKDSPDGSVWDIKALYD